MATILEKANEILAEKENKITPNNLKAGVSFFDVTGTLEELVGEEIVIAPTIESQTITPSTGFNGITKIGVSGVTSSIDENIIADNIKDGVTILGVTGNLTSGIDTSDATATATDLSDGKTAYVNGEKVTGTIRTKVSGNVVDYKQTQIVRGTETVVGYPDPIPFLKFKKTMSSDILYRAGSIITIYGYFDDVADYLELTPEKIVEGNTILGIEGTAKTGGIDTSDATAAANNIAYGYTAYVNGEKITGNVPRTTNNSSYEGTNIEIYKAMNPDPSLELEDRLDVRMVISTENRFMEGTTYATCQILYDDLVSLLGITANKIKAGETILGITGTYTGETE